MDCSRGLLLTVCVLQQVSILQLPRKYRIEGREPPPEPQLLRVAKPVEGSGQRNGYRQRLLCHIVCYCCRCKLLSQRRFVFSQEDV